jgi:hypothetical protein
MQAKLPVQNRGDRPPSAPVERLARSWLQLDGYGNRTECSVVKDDA